MTSLAIKYTPLGGMIYLAMALHLLAAGLYLLRARRLGKVAFAAGFVLTAAAWALRWAQVQHPPMQNLFEVFLTLAVLLYPLSLFCRKLLSVPLPAVDALIAVAVLFPAGLVFSAQPQTLPPPLRIWLFVPHVAAYMLAYVVLFMAAAQAAAHIITGRDEYEPATWRMVRFGFPLLTLGLVLGAVWGKLAWGDYWNWDPKELWSLASWLLLAAYLHFRPASAVRFKRLNSAWVLLACTAILMTLLWVNISRLFAGLHSYA